MLNTSGSFQEDVPNRTFTSDRINKSLGLLEQATGVSRGIGSPASSSMRGRLDHTPQPSMDYSLTTPRKPLSSFAVEDVKSFAASPHHQMLFTPSEKLTSALHDTSRNLPNKSILTTPSLASRSVVEPSMMLTPGRNLDVTSINNVNLLVEADPGITATEGLYEEFHLSFKTHQSSTEVFTLVQKYEELCQEQVELLSKLVRRAIPGQHKFKKTEEVLNQLEREKCTWRLLASLYQDRQAAAEEMEDEGLELPNESEGRSEKEIISAFYDGNAVVRQEQIVVDWLESCAADEVMLHSEKVEYYSQSVCWENSLHNMQQKTDGGVPLPRNHMTSLDPDAPIRQNKNLADLDKEDEVRLLKDAFRCIRAGQMEEAQRLCKKCSQSWRAATLEGWRLYHDPNVKSGVEGDQEPIEGNHFRDVWKMVCWRMAEDERFHMIERAIYAALSGNLRELLPACNTWLDYLWAYFKVMVDQKVEQELRDRLTLPRSLEPLPPNFDQKQLNVVSIFQELQATPHKNVDSQAKNKHHIVQKYLILNDLDTLTEEMAEWLANPAERLDSHQKRFLAHFILIIRTLGLQTREEMTVPIIEAFVKDLIEANRTELVAIYVAQLPPSLQVAYYAKFLEGVEEKEDQQRCLQLAEEAGLDVAAITKTVVENIRTGSDEAMRDLLPSDTLEAVTTEDDQKKIEAINWLVFDPSQRAEALKQSNALIRTFLEYKKHDAAREVFSKIPPDSVDLIHRNWQSLAGSQPLPAEDSNAIREHLCIQAYLDVLSAFNDWFDCYHNKKPVQPVCPEAASFHDKVRFEHEHREYEMELHKWEQTLSLLTKTVRDTAYNVLLFVDGGWMVDQQASMDLDDLRQEQMVRLRERCIPLLCTLLHTVLHATGLYRECLILADEVASEEFQLYKVFSKEEMKQLLSKLKKSSSCLLDQDLDALGYEI